MILSKKSVESAEIVTRILEEIRSEYLRIYITKDGVLNSKQQRFEGIKQETVKHL